MTTTVGISTQDTWTGPMTWPGLYHELRNVRYTHRYGNSTGGGPASFTCTVVVATGEKVRGIAAGKILRVWRGAENVWTGVINQPDTGGEGIGITAEGIATGMATRFICTERNNSLFVDSQVDAAISRGLPWKRTGNAPSYVGSMNPGATLKDALDEIAKQTGMEWTVTAGGNLYWSTPRTDVTHILYAAGQGGARTLDNFGTDFYASYLPVQDKQIDPMEQAPANTSGLFWSTLSTPKPHSGEYFATVGGASVGQEILRNGDGTPMTADLRGYDGILYWVGNNTTAGVTRTVSMTLYDQNSVQWTLGTSTYYLAPNLVWIPHHMSISQPQNPRPAGFLLDQVRGFYFQTDGAICLDDISALSLVRPNVLGDYPPQITADQANVAGRNKYGRYEINVDLTGQGQLDDTSAVIAAQAARDKYGYRTRWTQPFVAARRTLLTLGGSPVDLASIVAGARVRVFLADLNEPEIGTIGDAVEFVVGETDYDNENETLTLTPIDSQRKDLLTLLGKALPKGRSV